MALSARRHAHVPGHMGVSIIIQFTKEIDSASNSFTDDNIPEPSLYHSLLFLLILNFLSEEFPSVNFEGPG